VGRGPVACRSGDARAVRLGAEAAMEKHTSAHPREVYAAEVGRLGDEAESQVMLMDAWQKPLTLHGPAAIRAASVRTGPCGCERATARSGE